MSIMVKGYFRKHSLAQKFLPFLMHGLAFDSFNYAVESIREKLKAKPLILQVIG